MRNNDLQNDSNQVIEIRKSVPFEIVKNFTNYKPHGNLSSILEHLNLQNIYNP